MILGAIDIGTNSVRLLVAVYENGKFRPVCRDLLTTRLGAGLVKTGNLCPDGKAATIEAVSRFSVLAKRSGAAKTIIFGTSAMREAEEGNSFARRLEAVSGLHVQILSPETEAEWSYTGVIKSLPWLAKALVFDLGGGSCELTWPYEDSLLSCSLKIGAVYLTDQFLLHDPPRCEEIAGLRNQIAESMASILFPPLPLVGVGGTVTSLAAMALKMDTYDSERIHGSCLTRQTVNKLLQEMLALRTSERQNIPGVQKGRAAILPAGTLVVDALLEKSGTASVLVSEGDILLGSLYSLLADQHKPGS